MIKVALAAAAVVAACTAVFMSTDTRADGAGSDPLGEKTGGETTVWATGRQAFLFPAANLSNEERTRFVIGNSFFKRNWVEAQLGGSACKHDGSRWLGAAFPGPLLRSLPHARWAS